MERRPRPPRPRRRARPRRRRPREAPVGEPIQIGPVQADPRKRALKIAGIAILLLLALKVLPGVLFGGGGDDPAEDAFATVTPPGVVAPVVPGGGAPETALTFSDKNPFEPL